MTPSSPTRACLCRMRPAPCNVVLDALLLALMTEGPGRAGPNPPIASRPPRATSSPQDSIGSKRDLRRMPWRAPHVRLWPLTAGKCRAGLVQPCRFRRSRT
jgi:hypothetical protein